LLEGKVRVHQLIAVTWLALVCALAPACAEKRVALVIGNDRYANLPTHEQLQKAVNDAHAVGGALKQIGFDVISGENLGRQALVDKLDEFTRRLHDNDTAFFFSGHGVALSDGNYILPSDIPNVETEQETRLTRAALSERDIVSDLKQRGVRVAVVVLDACRTNPFARSGGKGVGGDKGLAPPPQVKGVFSIYAASSGQAARDRLSDDDRNPNSVFSRVLVPALTRPGIDLASLAIDVREEVSGIARAAGYEQQPAYYDETSGGRVYLAGPPPAAGQPAAAAPDAGTVWQGVKDTKDLAILDGYIAQFGKDPVYGLLARARREQLTKELAAGKELAREPARPAGGPQTTLAMAEKPAAPGPCGVTSTVRCAPLTAAQERALKPKDTFRECDTCPEMVVVPAGLFTMGSPGNEQDRGNNEGPQHVVTFRKPFAVGKTHVTVDQYREFVGATAFEKSRPCQWSSPSPRFAQDGTHPVVCVTWDDAEAYTEWLAKKTGQPYRLLSEAEWEYAARGQTLPGAYTRFWFGNDNPHVLCQYGNGGPCDVKGTTPAGKYKPNAFGLYDMAGNAWQWTEDCYHNSYAGAPPDGSVWTSTSCDGTRVIRGGSWVDVPRDLRAARRSREADARNVVGFRLARSLNGPDADHR
jgi:formylglycine-generating enzyme required for sulfatase activity